MTYPIDNTKIETAEVRWRLFRGFTILMHDPAEANSQSRLWGNPHGDPRLAFYGGLSRACDRLFLHDYFFRYSLCLVPPETYHCTLADGIHPENIGQIADPDTRRSIQRFIDGLPSSLSGGVPHPLIQNLYHDPGVGPIRFRLRKLSLPKGKVLLARLEPADDDSRGCLARLLEVRNEMGRTLVSLGAGALDAWNPHITIGYCAVQSLGSELKPRLLEWEAAFREETLQLVIEYTTYRLAGFLDMQTYYFA